MVVFCIMTSIKMTTFIILKIEQSFKYVQDKIVHPWDQMLGMSLFSVFALMVLIV